MNETGKDKLKRFTNDIIMSEAVYEVLLQSFLKPKKSADVHEKAASFIAIEMLQSAWKELERYKQSENTTTEKEIIRGY